MLRNRAVAYQIIGIMAAKAIAQNNIKQRAAKHVATTNSSWRGINISGGIIAGDGVGRRRHGEKRKRLRGDSSAK